MPRSGEKGERAMTAMIWEENPGTVPPPEDQASSKIDELAKLDPVSYDRCREAEAKALGIRTSTLDAEVDKRRPKKEGDDNLQGRPLKLKETELWPGPVNGAVLFSEVCAALSHHVVLPDHAAETVTLWAAHTYCFEQVGNSPRLVFTSPEMRCGKSRALEMVGLLVNRPLMAANLSGPVLFRSVEMAKPTGLIDEADSFLVGKNANDDLRGLINSGHSPTGSVLRCVGDNLEVRQFSTYSPVAIAMIGLPQATISDRAMIVSMRRKRPDEAVAKLRTRGTRLWSDLASRIARWVDDHRVEIGAADPNIPEELNDRAADNWRPLLAIADVAGGAWPKIARDAARHLSAEVSAESQSARVMLLEDVAAIFAEVGDKIATTALVARLGLMDERPWPEWKNGRPITARQLAKLLAPLKIRPGTHRIGADPPFKGYRQSDFADAISRYTPLSSGYTVTTLKTNGNSENLSVTKVDLLPIENGELFNGGNGVTDVTDQMGGRAENEEDRREWGGEA